MEEEEREGRKTDPELSNSQGKIRKTEDLSSILCLKGVDQVIIGGKHFPGLVL